MDEFEGGEERLNLNSIKHDGVGVVFGRHDVIPLWLADMDFKTPSFITDSLVKRSKEGGFGYTYHGESYYKSIVEWLGFRHSFPIEKEWVVNSPAVIPSLRWCIDAYSGVGDKVIVQSPVYHSFFSLIKNSNREVVENPLHESEGKYIIDYDHLDSICDRRVKLFFLCSPHNPVGRVWRKEELERLAEFCVRREIIIVSDEIFSDISFSGCSHVPIASLSNEVSGNTVTLMSASKSFNLAGLSNSYAIISDAGLRAKFISAKESFGFNNEIGNIFGMIATESALSFGASWINSLNVYLEGNADYVSSFLSIHIPLIKVTKPEGGYFMWLDCRAMELSEQRLKEFFVCKAGLGVYLGSMFGMNGRGFIRVNVASPRKILKKALNRLRAAYNSSF